ncbi:hypothetical protein AQUCO_00900577v1 [Aquilegia coerulea]|uniref:Uncharacterized protein n=1 Tax=Aquilegia coerulea TaxID=218851 RepID=A0A2G5EEV2_AQUCA|nr:hypothetical protein AQUCO_00900577v1 [Aquilegia coerulea]
MATKKKHLSSIANDVLHRCAETVDTSVDRLVQEFEAGWKFETGDYSRRLVEFCSSKALSNICCDIQEKIADGSFSRFSFDMMLAWAKPNAEDERSRTNREGLAKEKEDKKMPLRAEPQPNDDVSLFYSDLMPLLVDDESSVGEDAFVWLGSLVTLVVDVVNGRFTFETLTAATAQRLHFPAYDIFLKEIDKSETVVLEFPEMTSSTRREHWLTLIREVILMHQFLSKSKEISPLQSWEMQARTILAILRLHAAREMLRISPPAPTSFLIFSLFDGLPKGDYVLEELANTLKQVNSTHSCSASSILKSLNISQPQALNIDAKEEVKESPSAHPENISSLEATINQVREEAKEIDVAMATVEGLKEEGISDSFMVLMELLSPLKNVVPWCQQILAWDRPVVTLLVFSATLIITYKEWIGKAIAILLVWGVRKIYQARHERIKDRYTEIVVYTGSDQSSVESIVSAHHGLKSVQFIVQMANITILKIQSIILSKAPKHTNMVMMAMIGLAIFLAIIPLKFIIMTLTSYVFLMNAFKRGRSSDNDRNERRLKEWWNSIPAIPVRTVDKTP